jgi:hypothetical protein
MTPAEAIARTYMNREEIERSDECGCYRCLATFRPQDIALWSDSTDPEDEDPGALRPDGGRHRGNTAICPFCEDASVIGSASGFSIEASTLEELRTYWSKK